MDLIEYYLDNHDIKIGSKVRFIGEPQGAKTPSRSFTGIVLTIDYFSWLNGIHCLCEFTGTMFSHTWWVKKEELELIKA